MMTRKSTISLSFISGIIGALMTALIFNSVPSAHASVSTSGYYVCGNKTTGAMRMSNSSSKCLATEYRYFLLSEATDLGSNLFPKTAQIEFLTPSTYSCGGASDSISNFTYVKDVYYDKYSTYNPINVTTSRIKSCSLTVSIP